LPLCIAHNEHRNGSMKNNGAMRAHRQRRRVVTSEQRIAAAAWKEGMVINIA